MAIKLKGSVVFRPKRGTWDFLWWEDGHRHTRTLGSIQELPTRADAERIAAVTRRRLQGHEQAVPIVKDLVKDYRNERMPDRDSTKRGYEAWLRNHILPQWGDKPLTELQARPVELWLRQLNLHPKSKAHIRGLLTILWDFAMWRRAIPVQRNPMQLVKLKGVNRRSRYPVTLTPEQFQSLLGAVGDSLLWRTLLLVLVGFGLRISEAMGLKWGDVDWLGKTLHIERGVVKQVVDEVKTEASRKPQAFSDEMRQALALWKEMTAFSQSDDWIFASPWRAGKQPLSYTHVWEALNDASRKAGIVHVSPHTFRHTYRSWLDSVHTPIGVQQRLMRHADIRTTMNVYGDAVTADMRKANKKVVKIALFAVKK